MRHAQLALTALMLAASSLLSGCFTLAVTGVGATAMAIDDRRTLGTNLEDQNIEAKSIRIQLDQFPDAHFNITSINLGVLITGEAPTEEMKKAIGAAVANIARVKHVTNELVIGPNSALTARSTDTLITSNVKTRLIGAAGVSSNQIKVVTEAGSVFLMGVVTREEGTAAAEVARTSSGVLRVVKVFEYVEKSPARAP